MRWRPAGLWRDRDFMLLWTGQTVSALGSHVTGTALPLAAILALAASPVQLGVLAALGAAPVLAFGLLAGVWVDRLPRRPILIAADLGRAVILAAVPLAAALGLLRIGLLYAVAALVGLLTVFAEIANRAYLPSLLAPDRLVEGNSKLGASESVAEIGGPPLGGVLVQWLGAPLAVLFDAASFVVSAVCVGLVRAREPTPAPPAGARHVAREIAEGLRAVFASPLLRALAGSSGTFNFFGSFIGTLYALYLVRDLRLAPAWVGLLTGLGGVGALAGAFVAGPAVRRIGLGPALIGALLLGAGIQLLLPLAGLLPIAPLLPLAASQLLGDVWIAVYFIGEVSLRQSIIPPHLQGRANASVHVLTQGLAPAGALLAGALGATLGVRATIALGVAGLLLAALWLICSPIRALREQPAPVVVVTTGA